MNIDRMPPYPDMRGRKIDRAVTWLADRLHLIVIGAFSVFVLYLIFGVTATYALNAQDLI